MPLNTTKFLLILLTPALLLAQDAGGVNPPAPAPPGSSSPQPAAQPAAEGQTTTASPDTNAPANAAAPATAPVQDKRIFGVLPNYRTADGTIPFKPLTWKQKFTIARKDSLDYPSYVLAGFFAGVGQLDNSNPSFGQGVAGFARRYGTSVSDQVLGNFMSEAIWPSLLREDPRYFRKVNGSIKSRLGYSITRTVVARTDAGNWRFNAAEFLGNGTVAAIGNAYYPDGRSFGDTMQRMFTQIGTDTISNVLKEFWPDIKRKYFQKKHADSGAD